MIAGLRWLDGTDIEAPAWQAMLVESSPTPDTMTKPRAGPDRLVSGNLSGFPCDETGALVVRYLPEASPDNSATRPPRARLSLSFATGLDRSSSCSIGTSIEGAADRSVAHLLATLGNFDSADAAYTAAAAL